MGIKKMGKTMATNLLMARRRSHWEAPANRVKLSAEEKQAVCMLWGGVWSKPSYKWHEHYKAVTGEFDARYMPGDVFYLDILPKLSDTRLADAWADKAFYCQRFPKIAFPKIVFACIGGRLVDADLRSITWNEALDDLRNRTCVFVKPSRGSCQGLGAFKLDPNGIDTSAQLEAVLAKSGLNYVVQEVIHQDNLLASFNTSSVNIIRVNTVWLGSVPFLANATIRFGCEGEITDVAYIDGVETVRVAGIDRNGHLRGFYCDQNGSRDSLAAVGVMTNAAVPGYEDAVKTCLELHQRLHYFGIAAFDVAICGDGKPMVVEINLGGPGTVLYQYANGPFFGERTEEVIEWCESRKKDHAVSVQLL